ncbi:hypothetical protein BSZ36_10445 [Rubricoccus marinus]|uniref:DUF5683 domain-containing protein n=1 Tax=Rubricoccus marinus TaxID=716817 RepID=A0A259U3U2_9BACT|nr:hypothetical protein BSZ36_10445 [Rubricoccus marinus]
MVVDTAAVDTLRTPGRALRRSLLAPGLGQVYNGQAEKTPFVIVALLGAGAYAAYNHDRYLLYRHAFLYQSRVEAGITPNEFERFADEWVEAGSLSAVTLRSLRENARSSRDIAIVLTGAVYALQALDAYVSAHLQDFDVGEDLSLHVAPEASGGVTLTMRLGL